MTRVYLFTMAWLDPVRAGKLGSLNLVFQDPPDLERVAIGIAEELQTPAAGVLDALAPVDWGPASDLDQILDATPHASMCQIIKGMLIDIKRREIR